MHLSFLKQASPKQASSKQARNKYVIAFIVCLPALAQAQSGASISITEYAVPTSSSEPYGIIAGPDGALWFTEPAPKKIGRITSAGAITEFAGLTDSPVAITSGPDGALWFTESDSLTATNFIGRITTAGQISEYPLPAAYPGPGAITTGPDGALWFTETGLNQIGRITTSGAITAFPITAPQNSGPNGITAGPDGALWFTEGTSFSNQYEIDRITTAGVITSYALPTNSQGFGITAGPDGALWFTEYDVLKIGRITTSGVITEYPLKTSKPASQFITAGPDGALWFTETGGNRVGRITTAGLITEYPTATGSAPQGIAAGPNGHSLWFAERFGKIANVPACGLGLRLGYSAGTVEASFALGIPFSATFMTTISSSAGQQVVESKSVPAIAPPEVFTLPITKGVPASGTAEVKSILKSTNGSCQEYQSITIP